MNKLPEKLELLRKYYGYSQAEIAQKLQVPTTEYMKLENGGEICTVEQMRILANLYHITIQDFVDNRVIIRMPEDTGESVEIPFSHVDQALGDMDAADNMLPVEGVLPPSSSSYSQQEKTQKLDDVHEVTEEPLKTKEKPASDNRKKGKDRRPWIYIIGGLVAAALIFLIVQLRGSGSSISVSLSNNNRLALGNTYAVYIDKENSVTTKGSFSGSDFSNLVQISANGSNAIGLKSDGTVVSNSGLDVSDWKKITYVAAGTNHAAGVTSDGKVECTGSTVGCDVGSWSNVESVYAGSDITAAITSDHQVLACGRYADALNGLTDVRSVSIGSQQILVLKNDGTVTSIGTAGSAVDVSSWSGMDAICAAGNAAVGLTSNGTVKYAGSDEDIKDIVENWTNIRCIGANDKTILAVDKSGAFKGAGDNSNSLFVSEEKKEPDQLGMVTDITTNIGDNAVFIQWKAVDNADYYEVSVDTNPVTKLNAKTTTASVPVTSLEEDQTYTVRIISRSNHTDKYKDSETATADFTYTPATVQLSAPSNISSTSTDTFWTFTWDAVENADYYVLTIDDEYSFKTPTNSYQVPVQSTSITNNSTHTIGLTSYSDSDKYKESSTATVSLAYSFGGQGGATETKYRVSFQFVDADENLVSSVTATVPDGEMDVMAYMPPGYVLLNESERYVTINSDRSITIHVKQAEGGN